MVDILYRGKAFIITVTLIFVLMFSSYNFLANYNKLTMTLSLNYPNAEEGLNPDGTRFNIFKIKSESVLDRALTYCNVPGITVDELKERIDVYEKSTNKTTDSIKDANILGKDFKYISNEYSISYSQKNKLSRNHTVEMLTAITKAYREVFDEKHTEKNIVLKIDKTQFEEYNNYEYIEIADLLYNKLNTMERYISKRNDENGIYRSTETGETFANILTMIQSFKNIETEKYRAFIISSGLAKDKDAYIKKLLYNVDALTLERYKKISETNFVRGAIEKYDPNITGVAFIPSLDTNNEFYMNRTKTGLDYLTDNAYHAGIDAERYTEEIENNNYLINVFSNITIDENENIRLTQLANDMLKELQEKIFEIQTIALQTDNEYILYKTRDYVKFNIPNKTIMNDIAVKPTMKVAFLGFVLACILVILKELLFGKEEYNEDNNMGYF